MNINAWLVSEAYRSPMLAHCLRLDLMAVYKKDAHACIL